MSEVMENVGAATNVALGVKKADYEEFINQLDTILTDDSDTLSLIREVRDYYKGELEFISQIL